MFLNLIDYKYIQKNLNSQFFYKNFFSRIINLNYFIIIISLSVSITTLDPQLNKGFSSPLPQ